MLPFVSSYEIQSNNIIYVDDDGDADYIKIQDAIDNASNGDTIFVYGGIYRENIIINKSILLQGEDKDFTIIDANKTGKPVYVIANNVEINGFRLQNSGHKAVDAGISARTNFSSFSENILVNNDGSGIYINGNNNSISNNYIQNNSNGIKIANSNNNEISKNIINDNGEGFTISSSNHNKIYENIISNNTYGISLWSWYTIPGSEYISIYHNYITNNQFGIFLSEAKYTNINRNNFIGNSRSVKFWQSYSNNWDNNFWDRPRLFPKIIIGKTGNAWFGVPWINIDWHPASEPYDIPNMEAMS
jgi:parallel beta-helix repeat protein